MAQLINEVRRFQKIAGILKENDDQFADEAEYLADKLETSFEAGIEELTPEQIEQLKAELQAAGITADTSIEDIADMINPELDEAEGDTKQKVANALDSVGSGLVASLLVPMIPVGIGSMGPGFLGGLGITLGTAAILKAAAKALSGKKIQELDGNTAGEITADDIQVGATFEKHSTVYKKTIKITISRIDTSHDGGVYFTYVGMGNEGNYLLAGSREEAADTLNQSQGKLIQAAPRVKRD